jgi:hypothetical protein
MSRVGRRQGWDVARLRGDVPGEGRQDHRRPVDCRHGRGARVLVSVCLRFLDMA